MVPKLHKKGKSFAGAAAYLLHDKQRATSSDRVEWTGVRNLATDDPELAWRVMAATAMDQARLKELAGIKNTGRKSKDHVLHLTLSWHPDEADGLSHEEMMRAALGALRALGAADRQTLMVAHNDEPQPHLHLLVNRVSPTDGRMLSSSKEKLNLSRWAEQYEKERGQVLCEERVLNNAARDRGEYVRGKSERPRHLFEHETANDNHPEVDRIREEQRRRDAAVAKTQRKAEARHRQQWSDLVESHQQRKRAIRQEALRQVAIARGQARSGFKDDWRLLYHEHQASLAAFERDEERLLGRMKNAARMVDFGALVTGGQKSEAFKSAFDVLSSSGARLEALKRVQQAGTRRLERRQREAEAEAARPHTESRDRQLAVERQTFAVARNDLILSQRMDAAVLRAAWHERRQQRRAAFKRDHARGNPREQTSPGEDRSKPSGEQKIEADAERQQQIESFKKRGQARQQERQRERDREDRGR